MTKIDGSRSSHSSIGPESSQEASKVPKNKSSKKESKIGTQASKLPSDTASLGKVSGQLARSETLKEPQNRRHTLVASPSEPGNKKVSDLSKEKEVKGAEQEQEPMTKKEKRSSMRVVVKKASQFFKGLTRTESKSAVVSPAAVVASKPKTQSKTRLDDAEVIRLIDARGRMEKEGWREKWAIKEMAKEENNELLKAISAKMSVKPYFMDDTFDLVKKYAKVLRDFNEDGLPKSSDAKKQQEIIENIIDFYEFITKSGRVNIGGKEKTEIVNMNIENKLKENPVDFKEVYKLVDEMCLKFQDGHGASWFYDVMPKVFNLAFPRKESDSKVEMPKSTDVKETGTTPSDDIQPITKKPSLSS